MAKIRGAVVFDIEKCKGCGVCMVVCPTDTLGHSGEVNNKGYDFMKMIRPEKCIGCAACGNVCPDSVITVYRVRI